MKKDKNQDFDNYVKKALSNDPIVPSGLDWDSMDIDIPQKRKRKPFLFFMVGVCLTVGMFFSGYYFKGHVSDHGIANIESQVRYATKDNLDESSRGEKVNENTAVDENESSNGLSDVSEVVGYEDTASMDDKGIDKRAGLHSEIMIEKDIHIASVSPKENNSVIQNQIISFQNDNLIIQKESSPKTVVQEVLVENVIDRVVSLSKSQNTKIVDVLSLLPSQYPRFLRINQYYITSPKIVDVETDGYDVSNNEISLKFGMNIASFTSSELSGLSDKLSNVLGRSIQLGYHRRLGDHFILNTSIDYNESHTVFQHTEEVNSQINMVDRIRIITCRHTYQNNYSKTIGLFTGLGYRFNISNNFELQTNVNISANKLVSISGLTFSEDQIVNVSDLAYNNSINTSISPSVELRYSVTNNFGMQLSYGYNKSLTNRIDLGNNVRRDGMSQFFYGVYMKF